MKLPVNYNLLTPNQRKLVREEYIKLQKGMCLHCGNLLTDEASEAVRNKSVNEKLFPTGFFKWPIHLHHDHKTGITKGAVHCYCNAVLWQYFGE